MVKKMSFKARLNEIQQTLKSLSLDGWLLYDYRGSNPFFYAILEIPAETMLTRRVFYWIPQEGDPIKILPQIESNTLAHLPGIDLLYRTWEELEEGISSIVKGKKIAMEYSPNNALPNISKVDGGTIDLIRMHKGNVVSSANILQKYTSVLTKSQFESHLNAAEILCNIVDRTWNYISLALKSNRMITEYDVQQFMLDEMKKNHCVTNHAPICAVNAHSSDPHYDTSQASANSIKPGDFILIDLWCKLDQPGAIYADITRVAVAASEPLHEQDAIFQIVKKARDTATALIKENYAIGKQLEGWQVDQVCRDVITQAGYGDFFIHRTGHSIGEVPHGPGANIDNFETHDIRTLLPGTCFSIEPGIYLPGKFGVRLEYDVFISPDNEILVTGGIQESITTLLG